MTRQTELIYWLLIASNSNIARLNDMTDKIVN